MLDLEFFMGLYKLFQSILGILTGFTYCFTYVELAGLGFNFGLYWSLPSTLDPYVVLDLTGAFVTVLVPFLFILIVVGLLYFVFENELGCDDWTIVKYFEFFITLFVYVL